MLENKSKMVEKLDQGPAGCSIERVNFTNPSKLPLEFEVLLSSMHTYQKKCQKVLATSNYIFMHYNEKE